MRVSKCDSLEEKGHLVLLCFVGGSDMEMMEDEYEVLPCFPNPL